MERHSNFSLLKTSNTSIGISQKDEESYGKRKYSKEESKIDESSNVSVTQVSSKLNGKKNGKKNHHSRATTTGLVAFDEMSVKRRKNLDKFRSGEDEEENNFQKTNSIISPSLQEGENKNNYHYLNTESILSTQKSLKSNDYGSKTHSILSAVKSKHTDLPNIEHDSKYTKLFLQKQGLQNLSIWSHLTKVLNKIIAEKPENVIDYFEEYSRRVKQEQLLEQDSLKDVFVPTSHLEVAKNKLKLANTYGVQEDVREPDMDEEEEKEVQTMDLEEVAFYFSRAGVALPENEVISINIGMKKLAEEKQLYRPRFWGKILGTEQDYFILECELTEEEYEARAQKNEIQEEGSEITEDKYSRDINDEEMDDTEFEKTFVDVDNYDKEEKYIISVRGGPEDNAESEKLGDNTDIELIEENPVSHEVKFALPESQDNVGEGDDPLLPPLPPPTRLLKYKIPLILKPVPQETLQIPTEKIGEGLNKKIYYVSNVPESEWSELPKVTPLEINTARQMKVYMSGNLETQIKTYPAFPGKEKNYLRAQIARISSATQVSPLGFYRFGEGSEEQEEEEILEEEEIDETKIVENPHFQQLPIRDLIDPSLAFWVHHAPYILPQGRTVWWDDKNAAEDEETEEEVEEEEEEEEEKREKESGPPLLTPLAEDASIEGLPAWAVRRTDHYNAEMATALVSSRLWPGAMAFAIGKKFENIYIGWGHKRDYHGFTPIQLPHPEYEYELGPEILEIQDPTVEVEEAWRQAHKKKPPPGEEEEESEEEEEEEDEEGEEDDDE